MQEDSKLPDEVSEVLDKHSYICTNVQRVSPPKRTNRSTHLDTKISLKTVSQPTNSFQEVREDNPVPTQNENDDHEQTCGLQNTTDDEYKNSREHKSVLKAMLVNFLMFSFILGLFFVSIIVSEENITGGLIILISTMISLYRSFTPIISAIFCFDVIHTFFRQCLERSKSKVRRAINLI